MLYNNKKTLSALALILAMSVSLAENSYAQGVITLVDEDVDELGIQNTEEQALPAGEAVEINIKDETPLDVEITAEPQQDFENSEEAKPFDDLPIDDGDFPTTDESLDLNLDESLDIPLESKDAKSEADSVLPESQEPALGDNASLPADADGLPNKAIPSNPQEINMGIPDNVMPNRPQGAMPNRPQGAMPNRPQGAMPNMPQGAMPNMPQINGSLGQHTPNDKDLANKQAKHEAEIEKLSELGNSVLSQIDNELFSQMSDIEKQTTLLSLELRREKLKSEIEAIKAARQSALEKAEEEKIAREQRKKDMQTEKEIEKIKEQQLLEDKKIALEALRQEKALNDYRNKMLENEQKWISENQKLYNKMQQMDEERKAIIESFAGKLSSLKEKSQSFITAAQTAKQIHDKVVADLNMQNEQLKKRLEAETSMGKNPFGDTDANGQINESTLNKDYVIMEIRGKGEDLIAKLINKEGESFLVKKGSVLQSGHKIEKITHNYITLDKKGVKDYLQFTAGGIVDKEPQSSDILPKTGNLKDAVMSKQPAASSRPPLLTDTSIPSLGNGMFVK